MNEIKFKQVLLDRRISQTSFADKLGITYQALWRKLSSDSWSLEDIRETKKILSLTDDETREIFNL